MILIFDTFGGLCNQFFEINSGINFCIINNIKFSFRYCSFRNNNLLTWHKKNFEELFDSEFLKPYHPLYIDFKEITLTKDNTYNYENTLNSNAILNSEDDILTQLINFNKEYIMLKQFWKTYKFRNIIDNVNNKITPSKKLLDKYLEIKKHIFHSNEPYNFIHYRYEKDFTNYFNLNNIENLKDLILKPKFKDPSLKIYIATTNIHTLIDLNDVDIKDIIVTKNDSQLLDYNFEEKAFIDFMIGKNSIEVYGHSKSSFSVMLNNLKKTKNYYNS
jgi:hypothetical protein